MWGTDAYAQAAVASFKDAAEAAGAEAIVIDGKNDPLVQAKAIDTLIAQKVDGIVWQPSDPASAIAPATKIRNAGIPLVFSAVQPDPGSGVQAPFVPLNDISDLTRQAGVEAAKFVTEELNQTPKVVLFDLLNLPVCHEERMEPFMEGVKSVAPDAETVFWDTVPATKDGTLAKMENLLQANPDFNIFTGCGGDLILGGFAALQNAGRGKAVDGVPQTEWVLMIDGTPEQLALQIDPSTSVVQTISLTPLENGQAAWDFLSRMMSGELPLDASETASGIRGIVYDKSQTCSEINETFSEQFAAVFPPLDCE